MFRKFLSYLTVFVAPFAVFAQTEVDLNPIYKNLPPAKLSLLLRDSPSNLNKVYAGKPVVKINGSDTVLVAPNTSAAFAKLIASLHWTLVPVETSADTLRSLPSPADSSLVRAVDETKFNMVLVKGDSIGISDFYISQTEVTQRLWIAVMGTNPSVWIDIVSGKPSYDRPVENVSWKEVQQFIRRLNELTGRNYRLPNVKEWEYAANNASRIYETRFVGSNSVDSVAWNKRNFVIGAGTSVVAQKSPNALGIYDMSGNVWEWCADNFSRNGGNYAVAVGGCANSLVKDCSTDSKLVKTTNSKSQYIGFRIVEDY